MASETMRVDIDELTIDDDGTCWHEGRGFTGVAYELWPDGTLRSEQEYSEGYKEGKGREWYASGQMQEEADYHAGAYHGMIRRWHENGQLSAERHVLFAEPIWWKSWDESGRLLAEGKIDENSYRYKGVLAELAREKK